MIRIVGKAESCGGVEVTISMTMTLGEWAQIMDTIPSSGYPFWKVRDGIAKVIGALSLAYREVINEDEADMRRREETK